MKIVVGCPTYKRFDLCVQMIKSAALGNVQPDAFIIIDNSSGEFSRYCQENDIVLSKSVNIINAPYNLGVATSWNAIIKIVQNNSPDALLVVINDDILFHSDTLELMVNAALNDHLENNCYQSVYCAGGIAAPNAFSLFLVHPRTFLDTIGPFDESFWPAYYDDNDCHWRMKMKKLDLIRVANATATHMEEGSATLKSYTPEERARHDHEFNRNSELYLMKWGGMPGNERFIVPFDGVSVVEVARKLYQKYGF